MVRGADPTGTDKDIEGVAMIARRRILTGGIAAVVFCATAMAAGPSTSKIDELTAMRARRDALMARIEKWEAEADSQMPELPRWRSWLAEIRRASDDRPNGRRVSDYLGANPSMRDAYQQLFSQWMSIAELEAMADSEKTGILKYVMVARFAELKKLKSPLNSELARFDHFEDYWQAATRAAPNARQRALNAVERLKKGNGLPDFVADQARTDALSRFNIEILYGPAITLKTPPQLQAAREELHALEIRMTSSFPHWHE
jgi:hypothetical protein